MARKTDTVDDLDLDDLEDEFDDDEEEAPKAKSKKKAKKNSHEGIGAAAMAEHLGMTPKAFRAWLRNRVADGDIDLGDREGKERYNFGKSLKSPLARKVASVHKKYKDDVAKRKQESMKKAAAAKKKSSKKKTTSKKS